MEVLLLCIKVCLRLFLISVLVAMPYVYAMDDDRSAIAECLAGQLRIMPSEPVESEDALRADLLVVHRLVPLMGISTYEKSADFICDVHHVLALQLVASMYSVQNELFAMLDILFHDASISYLPCNLRGALSAVKATIGLLHVVRVGNKQAINAGVVEGVCKLIEHVLNDDFYQSVPCMKKCVGLFDESFALLKQFFCAH